MKCAIVLSFGLIANELFIQSNKNKLVQQIIHWCDSDLMETDALSLTKNQFYGHTNLLSRSGSL